MIRRFAKFRSFFSSQKSNGLWSVDYTPEFLSNSVLSKSTFIGNGNEVNLWYKFKGTIKTKFKQSEQLLSSDLAWTYQIELF